MNDQQIADGLVERGIVLPKGEGADYVTEGWESKYVRDGRVAMECLKRKTTISFAQDRTSGLFYVVAKKGATIHEDESLERAICIAFLEAGE